MKNVLLSLAILLYPALTEAASEKYETTGTVKIKDGDYETDLQWHYAATIINTGKQYGDFIKIDLPPRIENTWHCSYRLYKEYTDSYSFDVVCLSKINKVYENNIKATCQKREYTSYNVARTRVASENYEEELFFIAECKTIKK